MIDIACYAGKAYGITLTDNDVVLWDGQSERAQQNSI